MGKKEIDVTSKKNATVSLCMMVKNEESGLAKCLMNMKQIVDQMIVVDTGSTDRTKDMAAIFGAKMLLFVERRCLGWKKYLSKRLING